MGSNDEVVYREVRLVKYINSIMGTTFEWGKMDCGMLVAGCTDAVNHTDWVEFLSDKWTDKETLLDFLSEEGGIESLLTEAGYVRAEGTLPITGDVMLYMLKDLPCMHVQVGSKICSVAEGKEVSLFRTKKYDKFSIWRLT